MVCLANDCWISRSLYSCEIWTDYSNIPLHAKLNHRLQQRFGREIQLGQASNQSLAERPRGTAGYDLDVEVELPKGLDEVRSCD